jgi:solute carrier family 6 amino acid transporter-like protein 5/7/9/14
MIQVIDVENAEEKERPTWGHGLEFLMSCISMSVGLGNIWRFPFTVYENGGGAFLIPYIIVLLLVGRPLYYLEMTLGQFTSRGSVKAWQAMPALKGIGFGQMIGTGCVLTYYCSLIALTLFYMIKSFAAVLPWAKCWSNWETPCIDSDLLVFTGNRTNSSSSSAELYFK